MRLVDDDVAQVVEDVCPAIVVRQHAYVEHVRIREDDVRPFADLPAPLRGGVAVVDRRADVRRVQLSQRARLVLRQGLGGVEVERPGLRLAGDRVEDGQVEAQRLPRGCAGGEDHVLAPPRRIPGCTLVEVQLRNRKGFA